MFCCGQPCLFILKVAVLATKDVTFYRIPPIFRLLILRDHLRSVFKWLPHNAVINCLSPVAVVCHTFRATINCFLSNLDFPSVRSNLAVLLLYVHKNSTWILGLYDHASRRLLMNETNRWNVNPDPDSSRSPSCVKLYQSRRTADSAPDDGQKNCPKHVELLCH